MTSLSRLLLLSFVCLFFQQTKSQQRPELNLSVLDQFTFPLKDSIDISDSKSNELIAVSVAKELYKFLEKTDAAYIIKDQSIKEMMSRARLLSEFYEADYKNAFQHLQQVRKEKNLPAYRMPFMFDFSVYCRFQMQNPEDDSAANQRAIEKSFIDEIAGLDADFRTDLLYQLKGSYTESIRQMMSQFPGDILSQAMTNSNKSLSFSSASDFLDLIITSRLLNRFQPSISRLLTRLAPEEILEEKAMIPMRDGIRLSAFVYRPKNNQTPIPALISLSPYPSGFEATKGNIFSINGYVYVYVDTRGRRESEGHFLPYEHDAQDYYDIIDWVSKQKWCDGKVGTTGGSYLGYAQWQAIRKKYRHPALKAINPMVSVGFGIDFPRINQIYYTYALQWAQYVSGKTSNDALFSDGKFWDGLSWKLYKNRIPFCKLDSLAGMPNEYFQKWISHPGMDDYWKNILPDANDYKNLDIPVFTITGYYDDDQPGALYYYANHMRYSTAASKAKHQLLIGPFDHPGAQWKPSSVMGGRQIEDEAQIPIYKYVLRWFDYVLKQKEKPAFMKQQVYYYKNGHNAWASASSLSSVAHDSIVLYLSKQPIAHSKKQQGYFSMQSSAKKSDTLHYNHDIAMVIDSSLITIPGGPVNDTTYMRSPHNLVFESSPFSKEVTVAGRLLMRLLLSINVPDADMQVKFYKIDSSGASTLLSYDFQRLRYRNGVGQPLLAKQDEKLQWNLDKAYFSVDKIKKGERLRAELQFVNDPAYQKNFGFGGEVSREATSEPRWFRTVIYLGTSNASRIVIPVLSE